MTAICPKYLEHGFCIHGNSCTLQHLDSPVVSSQPHHVHLTSTAAPPVSQVHVSGDVTQHVTSDVITMNGNMLKTSFGNLTLEDISSAPPFIPSSLQPQQTALHNSAALHTGGMHGTGGGGLHGAHNAGGLQQVSHLDYYLPATRMEMPSRSFIPTPPHLDHPSPDISSKRDMCEELMYQQSITSLFVEGKQPDVDKYYALYPLEPDIPTLDTQTSAHTFSYPSVCYRAYSSVDGCVYTLQRFKNCQINTSESKKIVERWRAVKHPNIVSIYDAFPTQQFGDNSFIVVFEFCAGARSLKQLYFQKDHGFIEESLLWNYIIQLTAAIRCIHTNKLSCRMINPSKIIITGRNRLRLNCLGVMELLMGAVLDDPAKPFLVQHQQQEDMVDLGKLVVCLACNSMSAIHQTNLTKSSDVISSSYSTDVRMLLQHLLNKSPQPKKINDLMPMIGARFYTHIEKLRVENDTTRSVLRQELESGRLFRLLCKINSVLDRPEHLLDPGWCETSERYILKLFRNYLFHKMDERGAPWLDLPHIVLSLNKLDSGSLEQLMLTAPHEQSVIICTYKEIKSNFEKCFEDISIGQTNLLQS